MKSATFAELILRTAKIHEESYNLAAADKATARARGKPLLVVDYSSFYRKGLREAASDACSELQIEVGYAQLVALILHTTWNDILEWAGETYAAVHGPTD